MRTFKLTLAYDGTDYAGWQVQPRARTLQGVLEETLSRITGESVRVAGSGRTDAGVHALGQVVSFNSQTRLEPATLQRALLAELPADVSPVAVELAAPGFHARRDAKRKRYRYQLFDGPVRDPFFARRYAWHVKQRLDAARMHTAAHGLVGTHDFSSYETSGSPRATSVRTVHELFVCRGAAGAQDLVTVEIEANGFLYNMVRAIVGTLVEVGRGAASLTFPVEALAACDRRAAGPNAPPHGLFLVRVDYE